MAKFITIEGQDGAGKSTNIDVITECLKQNNIDYIVTREPGGTEFGETLREILLTPSENKIDDMAELLLMFAARAQHLSQLIVPALEDNKWVVCDRFTDASYAYQGGGRGIPDSSISVIESVVQGQLRPDLTILLDLEVEQGEKRAGSRSSPDRFEQEKLDFKSRVRAKYLERAEVDPNRLKVIDASKPLPEVNALVKDLMSKFINQHG